MTTLLAVMLWNPDLARAADTYVPFDGERSEWHDGFARYDFVMDEATLAIKPFKTLEGEKFGVKDPAAGQRRCIVIVPKEVAPGNPWSWQGCYWDHQPQTEVELLRRGFHVADTPGQSMPQMRYEDGSAKPGEKHAYTVITVNSVGLKSEPSAAGEFNF